MPEIVGARLATGADSTAMLNAGSITEAMPSDTEITMLAAVVPACAAPGVPDRRPVATSKTAQAGALAMPKRRFWPSGSDATGRNT